MVRSGRSWGALFGAIACLLSIGFLVAAIVESGGTKANLPLGSSKNLQITGRGRPVHQNLDPIYSSKRRVPNGSDPIHNRGAGKSGRPAGRA